MTNIICHEIIQGNIGQTRKVISLDSGAESIAIAEIRHVGNGGNDW
jgi:hypothetical protein